MRKRRESIGHSRECDSNVSHLMKRPSTRLPMHRQQSVIMFVCVKCDYVRNSESHGYTTGRSDCNFFTCNREKLVGLYAD